MNRFKRWGLIFSSAFITLSCNVFDPIDSPTNDEQMLSAARACFDEGDIECARAWYQKLANTYEDIRQSELAFTTLHEAGVTMEAFIIAGSALNGGTAITRLANRLAPSAGLSLRNKIYSAYARIPNIADQELRGLVRFVAATALAAEIIAEDAGSDLLIQASDLSSTSTNCTCVVCTAAPTSILIAGATASLLNPPATSPLTGTPTLGYIDGSFEMITFALQHEIGASGKFRDSLGGLAATLNTLDPTDNQCYRWGLINLGVGGS